MFPSFELELVPWYLDRNSMQSAGIPCFRHDGSRKNCSELRRDVQMAAGRIAQHKRAYKDVVAAFKAAGGSQHYWTRIEGRRVRRRLSRADMEAFLGE